MDTTASTAAGTGSSSGVRATRDGWFQVGDGATTFVLTVTLAFAQDLDTLLLLGARTGGATAAAAAAAAAATAATAAAARREAAYLYYSFLHNDIATDRFYSLHSPEFPSERTFLRLRGSAEDLADFFYEKASITVFACVGNHVLGFAEIDLTASLLQPLERQENDDNDDDEDDDEDGMKRGRRGGGYVLRRNTVTEGVCPFYTPEGKPAPTDPQGRTPILGVALSLVCETDVTTAPHVQAAASTEPAWDTRRSGVNAAAWDSGQGDEHWDSRPKPSAPAATSSGGQPAWDSGQGGRAPAWNPLQPGPASTWDNAGPSAAPAATVRPTTSAAAAVAPAAGGPNAGPTPSTDAGAAGLTPSTAAGGPDPSSGPASGRPTTVWPGADEPAEAADWKAIFRQSDEYRVALQLEIWRHEEEVRFKQDLDQRMAEVTKNMN